MDRHWPTRGGGLGSTELMLSGFLGTGAQMEVSLPGKDRTYSLVIHRAHKQQQKLDGLGGELKPCKLLRELGMNLGLGNVV